MHCCKFSIYLPWVEIVKISTIPSIECEEEYIKIKNRINNFIDKFINGIQSSIPNPKFQRERERLTISWNKRQKLKNTFPYRFLKESNSICSMFTLLLSILILCLAFFVIAHQSVVCWLLSFHLHLRLIFIYSPFLSFFLFFFFFLFGCFYHCKDSPFYYCSCWVNEKVKFISFFTIFLFLIYFLEHPQQWS